MAVFETNFISGSVGDVAELRRILEEDLPSKYGQEFADTLGNFSGTAFTDVAVENGVTLQADEILGIYAEVNWSGSIAGNLMEFGLYIDGGKVDYQFLKVPTGGTDTSSQSQPCVLSWSAENLTGSVNLALKGRVASGAGVCYVGTRHIRYERRKKAAP